MFLMPVAPPLHILFNFRYLAPLQSRLTLLVQEVTCDLSVLPVFPFPCFFSFPHEHLVLSICENGESLVNK